jgi:hypothetical protein
LYRSNNITVFALKYQENLFAGVFALFLSGLVVLQALALSIISHVFSFLIICLMRVVKTPKK